MILYEGYGDPKDDGGKSHWIPPERKIWPYSFHFEDWLGDEVYYSLFPIRYTMKQFITQLLIFILIIILMKVSVLWVN